MKIIFLLITLVGLGNICSAQDCLNTAKKLEDLENRFSKMEIDIAKHQLDSLVTYVDDDCWKGIMLRELIEGRIHKAQGKTESAVPHLNQSLAIAESYENIEIQKHIIDILANMKEYSELYQESIDIRNNALAIPCHTDSLRCKKLNIRLKLNNASTLTILHRFQEAIETYEEAIEFLNSNTIGNDSIYRLSIFNSIGNIYDSGIGNSRASLNNYEKALEFCPSGHKARYLLFNNIGSRYYDLNKLDSATYFYNITIEEVNLDRYLCVPWQGKGDISIKSNDYPRAIECYQKALGYAEASNRTADIYLAKALLAKANFLNGNYAEANALFDSTKEYYHSKTKPNLETLEIDKYNYINQAAMLSPRLGKLMYQFHIEYDSIHSVERENRLDNSLARLEKQIVSDSLNRAQLLLDNQSLTIKNQRLSIWTTLLLLISSLYTAYFISKRLKYTKSRNTELIYKNEELVQLNQNLTHRMDRLKTRTSIAEPILLNIKSLDKMYQIDTKVIRYLKAEDNGVRIFYQESSLWTDKTLKNMLTELPHNKFIQIYRSTVVNLDYIEWVNHITLRLKDGTELKIGRTYKDILKNSINQ